MTKPKVNVTRMEQLIGKQLIITLQGESGSFDRVGTLAGVNGRVANFDGWNCWIPSIKAVKEQQNLSLE